MGSRHNGSRPDGELSRRGDFHGDESPRVGVVKVTVVWVGESLGWKLSSGVLSYNPS